MSKTAYIFGAVPGDEIKTIEADNSLVLFCDGGIVYSGNVKGGRRFLLGDFDSMDDTDCKTANFLSKERISEIKNGDIISLSGHDYEVIKFPVRKDASDLELAMDYAKEAGATEIVVYGCLGGNRPDHLFVNLLMAVSFAERGIKVVMTDGRKTYAAFKNGEITVKPFRGHIGVLAVTSPAEHVSIKGLSYEAEDITLLPGSTAGTSNYFEADAASPAVIKAGSTAIVVCGNFGPDKTAFI